MLKSEKNSFVFMFEQKIFFLIKIFFVQIFMDKV